MYNRDFLKIEKRYLFSRIEARLASVTLKMGKENIINLGIGDICKPISPVVKKAFIDAIEEMGQEESVKGYGPALGYSFLRKKICDTYYQSTGLCLEEIFITDGINSPITQILSIFATNISIAIPNPAYPVYLDNAIMKGLHDNITTLALVKEHDFHPVPPKKRVDVVYLCSPGNPTGTVMPKKNLQEWVDWATEHKSIILFDAAYACFIDDDAFPKSIFEIRGAEFCAIEFMSFSKNAAFTGLRLGSVAMSTKIGQAYTHFKQYLETVSNGVSYPVQRAGMAALSEQGKKYMQKDLLHYKECARQLKKVLIDNGFTVYGATHSPYLWIKTPSGYTSDDYCDMLLDQGVVAISGSGFGSYGQGYFRLSCFISMQTLRLAVQFFQREIHDAAKRTKLLTS